MAVRVAINGRFLTQSITGVQRYAIELVRAIDRLLIAEVIEPSEWHFVIFAPRNTQHDLALKKVEVKKCGPLVGHLWEQLQLPFLSRKSLLLSLCNTGPMLMRNHLITIHDAAVRAMPGGYSAAFKAWYEILLPNLCRNACRIFTVSDFSMRELLCHYSMPDSKLRVVTEGCEHIHHLPADTSIFGRFNIRPNSYVLAVSTLNPNKNFALVVRAIELMKSHNVQFVIAGGADPRIFSSSGELPRYAKRLGYVTDGELRALYEGAVCLIYPSVYEGFGLPPLEAMRCGCPVIVSGEASLPEICGDAALYCDARNPADLAAKIAELVGSSELRHSLSHKGMERSARFSWDACALQTVQEMRAVLTRPSL